MKIINKSATLNKSNKLVNAKIPCDGILGITSNNQGKYLIGNPKSSRLPLKLLYGKYKFHDEVIYYTSFVITFYNNIRIGKL